MNNSYIKLIIRLILVLSFSACSVHKKIDTIAILPATVKSLKPLEINYNLKGSKVKKVLVDLNNLATYGSLSLYANNKLLIDNLNIPNSGKQTLNSLVQFDVNRQQKVD